MLRQFVKSGHPRRESACAMAIRRMSVQEAQAWLKTLASNPGTRRLAVQAAGVIGDPANIPWLMQQMADPIVARVGGNRSPSSAELTSHMTIWMPINRKALKPVRPKIRKTRTSRWMPTRISLGPSLT